MLASKQPWSNVFDFLSLLNIVNKEFVEGPDAKSSAIGTGPFTLEEWVPGDHVTYGKHKNYWQSGRPYLDGIQLTIARDPQSQMVQFESGAIDFTVVPSLVDYARLRVNPQYQAIELPNPGYYFIIQPNPNVDPFIDKRARQALNHVIDRNRIAAAALLGLSEPRDLPWPPGTPADEPPKQTYYNHDPEKAKALLIAAGLSDMNFEIMAQNTNPSYRTIAELIAGELDSIGVKTTLTFGDRSVIVPRQNQHQFQTYVGADFLSNLQPVSALTGTASLTIGRTTPTSRTTSTRAW